MYKISNFITSALRANRIKGPIQITAFGDVQQLSRSSQEALSSTGVILTHIPSGRFFFSLVDSIGVVLWIRGAYITGFSIFGQAFVKNY